VSGSAAPDGQRSVFILSPHDRDWLCHAVQAAGWHAIGARRSSDAPQRYLRSEAQIVLIDMREGPELEKLLTPLVPATVGCPLRWRVVAR